MNGPVTQLPFGFAKRYGVFLERQEDHLATVACPALPSAITVAELRRRLGVPIAFHVLPKEEFTRELAKAYEAGSGAAMEAVLGIEEEMDLTSAMAQLPRSEELLETEDDAPVIRLINALFAQAIKQNASDIHIETFEERMSVRFRIDGVLSEVLAPSSVLAPLLVSRVKVMARLDIAEKRLPQDGRIALRIAGRPIDVRVSTLPASYGERVVLRLLDKQAAKLDLSRLGMADDTLRGVRELIAAPHGIFLITGPTGSGKTTTLYAILTELNQVSRNILTVEDPVEYDLPGIGQTQVNPKVDLTFARGLRSILRQDPDVVMVGEIRDLETAEVAVQASLTGHLVLSTLHTNTAIGAVTRLRDMGIEPFLIASTLIGTAAQRLVRLLCTACKKRETATPREHELMGIGPQAALQLYQATGCPACNQTGYRGRTGIYEVIPMDDTLRTMIHDNASEGLMEKYVRQSVHSIRQDGFRRVLAGETTLAEVLRVTAED